jgi:hypothetical protein
MKFLFLLWIAMEGIFEASVWATAAWCLLYSFSNISWLQCFWISLAIQFVGRFSCAKYVKTHSREDCLSHIRRESRLVGLHIISAPILSILPTVAAIILLSLLQVWTQLETHWLHTWLLVTCLVFIFLRACEARKMALQAKSPLRPNGAVEQPDREGWLASRKPQGKAAGPARKATRGPRSVRVIDV